MRTEISTRLIYSFDELDEYQKNQALDLCREWNTDEGSEWFDCVYEDFKEITKLMGFDENGDWTPDPKPTEDEDEW